jgi:hypothetical protein
MAPSTSSAGRLVVLACAALAACSAYGPGGLAPGSTVEAAVRSMGPPTGDYTLPDGRRRVEFARGPMGKNTYMLDYDAQGRLQSAEQVLTEQRFNAIRAGMAANEVLLQLGRPSKRFVVGLYEKQTVWAYRYETPFCTWFMVGLDPGGQVVDTAYGPDPVCDVDERR